MLHPQALGHTAAQALQVESQAAAIGSRGADACLDTVWSACVPGHRSSPHFKALGRGANVQDQKWRTTLRSTMYINPNASQRTQISGSALMGSWITVTCVRDL